MLLRFGSGSVFGSAGDFGSKCQPKIYIHPYVTDVFLVYYENKPFRQFFFWYRLKKNDAWLKKKKKKKQNTLGTILFLRPSPFAGSSHLMFQALCAGSRVIATVWI